MENWVQACGNGAADALTNVPHAQMPLMYIKLASRES